ncbi:flavin monoamine oxidase family protein [Caulobacter sp. S45]|uniref:flavin monoamine oxidase family protein n=1 Tax=Caulobacter sp. S45 TaxID=1641861 RepID=UPI00131C56C0|nr:flavin monoamine oxidase family protein [Caulobacter sp. S45]
MTGDAGAPSRRDLLSMIGVVAGSTAMYMAMYELGYAQATSFKGPAKLSTPPTGTSVLILGAGVAGMVAALEMRDAGYKVQVLEYQDRPGGRNWSLYGGDTFTELGGATQHVGFDPGLYLNPGPWRIPYHHQGILHYAQRTGVEMEPFVQTNFNAYVHSMTGYGGKPRRYREVQADYQGHVAELLGKCAQQGALDQKVSKEEREILLESLREWGALDKNYDYVKGMTSSNRRGFDLDPGGGLTGAPRPSEPDALGDVLSARLWTAMSQMSDHMHQSSIFQPKGGMGMIGKAMGRELGPLIRYNSKIIDIHQDDRGVTVTYVDTKTGGPPRTATAQWCVCTIPLPVLGQIPMTVGAPLKAAIDHMAYTPSLKVGLQFKRRFWEQDEQIYGGITYTDMPNVSIGYPNHGYFSKGKGVVLGAYVGTPECYTWAAKPPEERIKDALYWGSKIHPQYMSEYDCGVAVAWHRVPWVLGCKSQWTEASRAEHYDNLAAIDGRIVLAGEHVSYMAGWQEGSVTSATDAIKRLHQRVMSA